MSDSNYINMLKNFFSNGINEIVVSYSGSGDSGAIDGTESDPAGKLDQHQKDIVEHIAYDILKNVVDPNHDWWNNDGGQGTLVFTLEKDNIKYTINHEQNEEVSEAGKPASGVLDIINMNEFKALFRGDKTTKITTTYNGGYDEGYIENISVNFESRKVFQKPEENLIEDTARKLLDQHYEEWTNDRGSFGKISFYISDNRIKYDITYNQRYTEQIPDSYDGTVSKEENNSQ